MFEVKRATAEDAESILKITRQAFGKYIELAGIADTAALHESVEDVLEDIQNKLVYVAYMNKTAVGSVRVEIKPDKTAYLSRFGVSDQFQNIGIGKAIMNAFDMDMRAEGVKKVCLHTASKVMPLVRFYYGRGFYVDSTTKDKGYIRALMCKEYQ